MIIIIIITITIMIITTRRTTTSRGSDFGLERIGGVILMKERS